MIMTDGIMMLKPLRAPSTEPLIDEATRRMTAAYRTSRPGQVGFSQPRVCSCGAQGDNFDHWIEEGKGPHTTSLCIHFLAYHRSEVPGRELVAVLALQYGEAEPNREELVKPLPSMVYREVTRNRGR